MRSSQSTCVTGINQNNCISEAHVLAARPKIVTSKVVASVGELSIGTILSLRLKHNMSSLLFMHFLLIPRDCHLDVAAIRYVFRIEGFASTGKFLESISRQPVMEGEHASQACKFIPVAATAVKVVQGGGDGREVGEGGIGELFAPGE